MTSFISTKSLSIQTDIIRCKAKISSSPHTLKIDNPLTKLSKSGGVLLSDLRVNEIVTKQSRLWPEDERKDKRMKMSDELLEAAYERCRCVCEEYAKTFYLGTWLMTEERRKAIWAIYVWCRRTDELVDGPNATHTNEVVLDRWEQRLEDIFQVRPYDMLDATLTDTVYKFPIDIMPFRDMIEGMRMDTRKLRYQNFKELYLYCYYVAGTVGLMSVPVMGIPPESYGSVNEIYNAALNLGIGNQLTNILRDVVEDAHRGRIYLPQDELAEFGISEEDVFSRRVTDRWRAFMKEQITRARLYFDQAEEGASRLNEASRWPVWASLLLYRKILDSIEKNDYDNLTKRAYVGRTEKLLMLPLAFARATNISKVSIQ